jgi:stalled ribosome alternative rescue factor ArfA
MLQKFTQEESFFQNQSCGMFFFMKKALRGGFAARISQRVFVIGRIEREPDSSLVSVLLEPLFREKYSEAEKAYSGSVRKAKHKTQDAPVEVPKPDIMQNAQVKGDTLEIHVKNIVKEDVVPLHKDDVIVYREGVLTVEDASGEETHESFGVYGLKSEKDSLVLD